MTGASESPRSPDEGPQRVVAILPARLASTRLPRKMLLADTGVPLFVHAARNAARCPAIGRVLVATDSEEIQAEGERFGVETLATRADHPSGTDRVHEALGALERAGETFDVVLNVQADEPDVPAEDLARLVHAFRSEEVEVATLCAPLATRDLGDPSVVKVVRDRDGRALYFSRAPIPCATHAREARAATGAALRHVGVYAFRPATLARFCALPLGRLEEIESLEQLRWLEAGERMHVLDATRVPAGVDTRADYDAFVARQRAATTMEGSETR